MNAIEKRELMLEQTRLKSKVIALKDALGIIQSILEEKELDLGLVERNLNPKKSIKELEKLVAKQEEWIDDEKTV